MNNIQIEALKKYIDYKEDTDALYLESREAYSAYRVANDKRYVAEQAWNEAMNNRDFEAWYEAWDEINADEFYNFVRWSMIEMEEDNWYSAWPVSNYFTCTINTEGEEHKYVAESGDEYTYPYWINSIWSFEYEMTADIRELELMTLDQTTWRKDEIKNLNEEIKADETEYAEAVKATAAAKKAWDEAAAADKDAKKAEYEAALSAELQLKGEIEDHKKDVENYTKEVAIFEKALEMAKNAETLNAALQEKIEAYNNAHKEVYAAELTAWDEYKALDITAEEVWAEYSVLNNLYWNANNIADQIKELEEDNKDLLDEIAEAEKLLTQYDGQNVPYELAIELQKQWISAYEAIVAAQELKVEEAKKALDAAMPAEEEEGTEAPEEGTEETPAE